MTIPILYSFRRCPYAIRARLAILASGKSCEIREVSLANKPFAMTDVSPKATIPVMVLPDGRVLDESLDIMQFVLQHHDPNGWLGPVGSQDMALITVNDGSFKEHLDRYKYPDRYETDPQHERDAACKILARYESQLTATRFLGGAKLSIIDIAILPLVRQFAAVDEAWFLAQPIPNVKAWLANFLASASFMEVMVRLPIWSFGDAATVFPGPALLRRDGLELSRV